MATTKLLSTLIADQLSLLVTRRGFAAATHGEVARASGTAAMMKKGGEESKKSSPWVPDPVTGYYKPEGQTNQIDAVELRELLLKQKNRRQ